MKLMGNKVGTEFQLSFIAGTGMSVGNLELRVQVNYSCLVGGQLYTATDLLSTMSRYPHSFSVN
jgi:hypothetical protein